MELDVKTQSAVRKIVKENVNGILRNYLTEDMVRKITNEILAGVEWDLGNMTMPESLRKSVDGTLRDCVNELCLQCGKYHEAHLGACDGCRWKDTKEALQR